MPKHNGTGSITGKGPKTQNSQKVIQKPAREKYTLDQKFFAIKLKKAGKKANEISKLLNEKYGISVIGSTLATFYSPKNMKRFEEIVHRYTHMASVETCINKKQLPTIMVDMEFALLSMVKKLPNIGHAVTKPCLKKMDKDVFKRLRALQLYDDCGERLKSLSDLSEEHMSTLLSADKTICPLCKDDNLPGHDALLEHLQDYHAEAAAQSGGSTPEKAPYEFTTSDGWVQKFWKRHNDALLEHSQDYQDLDNSTFAVESQDTEEYELVIDSQVYKIHYYLLKKD